MEESNNGFCEAIIVSYDCTHGVDTSVMIVGRKKPRQEIEVINAFAGEEAEELWKRLTTRKERNDVQA